MDRLGVIVAGAGGRMGRAIITAVASHPKLRLHAAVERPGGAALGRDAATLAGLEPLGVLVTDDLAAVLDGAGAIIDFTTPAATLGNAALARRHGLVHVIGTTGCSPDDDEAIAEAARGGARIVKSGNFSMGVAVLASLVRQAGAALAEFDIEIVEMHHRGKVDAPSGTALMLGEAAAQGRGVDLASHSVRGRDGHTGTRDAGTIGFASLRGGTVVGEHMVTFAGPAERIELTHRAEDRAIFANGAVRAAIWAAGQPAGLYSMNDVLGL